MSKNTLESDIRQMVNNFLLCNFLDIAITWHPLLTFYILRFS